MKHLENKVYDIAIFGGGFCGLGAAFKLTAQGHSVLLVEPRSSIGWEATWAYNMELETGISKYSDVLAEELSSLGAMKGKRIDPVATEISLLKMAENIDILLFSFPAGGVIEDKLIKSVSLGFKGGIFNIRAKAFADATDNTLFISSILKKENTVKPEKNIFTFFMNALDKNHPMPEKITYKNKEIIFRNSPFADETAIEFESSKPQYNARIELPELLQHLRKEVPALRKAVVSHTANIEFPVYHKAENIQDFHDLPENCFRISPFKHNANSLAHRMKAGEEAATEISKKLDNFPVPEKTSHKAAMPIAYEKENWDTIVCGGGTGGVFAAIAAGRNGCKTKILEASVAVGGIATAGLIHIYYWGIDGGIQDEIDAETERLQKILMPETQIHGFHPEARKIALMNALSAAGVEVEYESTISGAETVVFNKGNTPAKADADAPRLIKSVITNSMSGMKGYNAGIFIDSTGDADLAALAGCGYTFGRDTDAIPHSYSQPSNMLTEDNMILVQNFDIGYCDPTDPRDLSRSRIKGVRNYAADKYTDKNRIIKIAPLAGIRNSRLIKGKYRIRFSDQLINSEFDDVIAYSPGHYDNHALDYENESEEAMLWVWGLGNWHTPIGCEIPYRSLLPENIPNLLIACRAISMEHDAHNQLRMQRDIQRIGEAAGTAAALAHAQNRNPSEINVGELQDMLLKTGALKNKENKFHWDGWKPANIFKAPKALSGKTDFRKLIGAASDDPELRKQLNSEKPEEKYDAAIKLGISGDEKAIRELMKCVEERAPIKLTGPGKYKTTEFWKPAIAILGFNKVKEAVPLLEAVLKDKTADRTALIFAMKALTEIGSTASAAAINEMLKRDDLPVIETFQQSTGKTKPYSENVIWKIELAAADCLFRMGFSRLDLVEKYLDHESSIVRRSAAKMREKLIK